jgi:tRNA dimethylallyltransferase
MDATDTAETGSGQRAGLIIAGPTASGKSALALALAQALGGTVINADAMQCYAELRVLTARPTPAEEALAPHRLYGVRRAEEPANAAWWRRAALAEMERARFPILCGGTGLYLAALVHGIAPIPEPGEAARAEARRLLAEIGPAALHARLDEASAARLRPQDSQRVARAYEVLRGTGRGLAYWQSLPAEPLTGWRLRMILLDPPRADLRAAIETRFAAMLAGGALAEAAALLARNLPHDLPLLRAHGMPELAAHLNGEVGLEEARARAVSATSRYTKRQMTWFRHQQLVSRPGMQLIKSRQPGCEQLLESIITNIRNFM